MLFLHIVKMPTNACIVFVRESEKEENRKTKGEENMSLTGFGLKWNVEYKILWGLRDDNELKLVLSKRVSNKPTI